MPPESPSEETTLGPHCRRAAVRLRGALLLGERLLSARGVPGSVPGTGSTPELAQRSLNSSEMGMAEATTPTLQERR